MVDYFRAALSGSGQVFAADYTPLSPALYRADDAVRLPKSVDDAYAREILAQCLRREVRLVVPFSDLELPVLSRHVGEFSEQGVELMVCDPEAIDVCTNKWKTYLHLKKAGIPVPETYDQLDEALAREVLPLVIKPKCGSASRGLHVLGEERAIRSLWRDGYIAQRQVIGPEYGLDILLDLDGRVLSVMPRRKLAMRAGETDKAACVHDEELIRLGIEIAASLRPLGVRGPIDVDLMVAADGGEARVLEINPRFGGGYPVAHLAGAKFPEQIVALVRGEEVQENIGRFRGGQVLMLKELGVVALDPNRVPEGFKGHPDLNIEG